MGEIQYGMPTLIETKNMQDCVKLCKELGLEFIEINMNLPQYQIENIDINEFKVLLKKENVYFTIHLDENLNICDFSYIAKNVDENFIRDNINKLYHMHLHDANSKENHLPLGSGEINIEDRLSIARRHGCRVVLETKTIDGLKKSVEKLNDFL